MSTKRPNWNAIADTDLHGWALDHLVPLWARESASLSCDLCRDGEGGACVHNAARTLLGLLRFVEHDPDCEICAQIHARRA